MDDQCHFLLETRSLKSLNLIKSEDRFHEVQNQFTELLINILFFWNTLRGAGWANLCKAVVPEADASSLPVGARTAGILIVSLGSGQKVPMSALDSEFDDVCSASKNTPDVRERGFSNANPIKPLLY